jgi:hypothetical protein
LLRLQWYRVLDNMGQISSKLEAKLHLLEFRCSHLVAPVTPKIREFRTFFGLVFHVDVVGNFMQFVPIRLLGLRWTVRFMLDRGVAADVIKHVFQSDSSIGDFQLVPLPVVAVSHLSSHHLLTLISHTLEFRITFIKVAATKEYI